LKRSALEQRPPDLLDQLELETIEQDPGLAAMGLPRGSLRPGIPDGMDLEDAVALIRCGCRRVEWLRKRYQECHTEAERRSLDLEIEGASLYVEALYQDAVILFVLSAEDARAARDAGERIDQVQHLGVVLTAAARIQARHERRAIDRGSDAIREALTVLREPGADAESAPDPDHVEADPKAAVMAAGGQSSRHVCRC
jgi:hypothetical protein